MNFGLSFSYIFKDEAWFKKLLLPGLCMLIPIVGWMITLGWSLQVTRNLIDGSESPLPDLDFGGDLGRGLFAFLIGFVYNLPATLVSALASWVTNRILVQLEVGNAVTIVAGLIFGMVTFFLSIAGSFLALTGTANYIATGEFTEGFKLGRAFNLLKGNFVNWLIVLLGTILAVGLIAPIVGSIACIIGLLVTLPYGMAVSAHLLGQAYNRAKTNPETPDNIETL